VEIDAHSRGGEVAQRPGVHPVSDPDRRLRHRDGLVSHPGGEAMSERRDPQCGDEETVHGARIRAREDGTRVVPDGDLLKRCQGPMQFPATQGGHRRAPPARTKRPSSEPCAAELLQGSSQPPTFQLRRRTSAVPS